MLEIIVNLIISIAGSMIATVVLEAIKNKKNNRPESANFDDHSSHFKG